MTQSPKTAEGGKIKTFLQANIWIIPIGITVITCILFYFFGDFGTTTIQGNPIITVLISYWFWIILIMILLIIYFGPRLLKSKSKKINWKWLWVIPALFVIYLIYYEWKSDKIKKDAWRPNVVISTEARPIDLSSYEELAIGTHNGFEAGKWKRFKFKASHTSEQKYLNFYTAIGSYDPVVLTFKQVSTGKTWQWKIWRDVDGEPQSELLYGAPQVFVGDCLVHSDKTADVLVLIE